MAILGLLKPDIEQLKARRDVAGLVKALHDKDYDLRKRAAAALLAVGSPAVPSLVIALSDENVNVRVLASGVLAELAKNPAELYSSLKDLMLPPLLKSLKDEDATVRRNAAFTLGEIGDDRALQPLLESLVDPEAAVRQYACAGLGMLCQKAKDPAQRAAAATALITCAKDGNIGVRLAAIRALGALGDPGAVSVLITAARDKNHDVRIKATEALIQLDRAAVIPIVAAMSDRDPVLRSALEEALVKITGKPAAVYLTELLSDRRSEIRCAAARALGRNSEVSAIGSLVAVLRDPDANLRLAAADALDILSWEPDSMERVVDFAIGKRQWDKCVEAGASAVRPLIGLLSDTDKEVASAAEDALARIGAPAAGPLAEKLKDENPQLRATAARILDHLGSGNPVAEHRPIRPVLPPVAAPKPVSAPVAHPANVPADSTPPARAPVLPPAAGLLARKPEPAQAITCPQDQPPVKAPAIAEPTAGPGDQGNLRERVARLGLRPLGNRKRLGYTEGKDCNAYLALFKEKADAERYYEAFVRYARRSPPPVVIEVMAAHVPKIVFAEKYAFVLPYFSAGARLSYSLWVKEAMAECGSVVKQQNYTAGKYELLPGLAGAVSRWDILLSRDFDASSNEGREVLCDSPELGYGTVEIEGGGRAVPGKPRPAGPWIGVLCDLSKLGDPGSHGEAAAGALRSLAGAGRLAGSLVHGGVYQDRYWCSILRVAGEEQAEELELAVLASTLAAGETVLALDTPPVLREVPAGLQALPYLGYFTEDGEYVRS